MNALRTLLTLFDVETSSAETKLSNLDKTIGGVKGALAGAAKQLFGLFAASKVKGFIESQIRLGDGLVDTATKLGVGTEELQRFQYAAGLVGVSAEGAALGLQFLNKNVGDAISGNKAAAEAFQKLGIDIKSADGKVRDTNDLLPELADGFAKMGSQQERTAAAMQIFGRSGASLLPLLQQGGDAVRELNKEFDDLGGGLGSDFLDITDKAGDNMFRLEFAMSNLKARIAVAVLPTVNKFIQKLTSWIVFAQKLERETNIAKEAWTVLGAVAALAAAKAFLGWAKFLGLFSGKKGLVENVFSLGKFGLIVAAVVLLALAFEDVYTWINGGESVIGEFLEKTLGIEGATELADQFRDVFDQIFDAVDSVKGPLGDMFKLLLDLSVSAMPVVLGAFVDLVRLIAAAVVETSAFANAFGKLTKGDFKGAGAALKAGDSKVFGEGGIFGPGTKSATLEAFNAATAPKVRQPSSFERDGTGTRDVSLDQRIEINIDGSKDPEATGRAVSSSLRGTQADGLRAAAAAAFRGAGADE